jgi:hypothetical protein
MNKKQEGKNIKINEEITVEEKLSELFANKDWKKIWEDFELPILNDGVEVIYPDGRGGFFPGGKLKP